MNRSERDLIPLLKQVLHGGIMCINVDMFMKKAEEVLDGNVEYVTFGDIENVINASGLKFSTHSYKWLNNLFDSESNRDNELNVYVAPDDETIAIEILCDRFEQFAQTLN